MLPIKTPFLPPQGFGLLRREKVLLLVCMVPVTPMSLVAVPPPPKSLNNRDSGLTAFLRQPHREIMEIVIEIVKRNQALGSSLALVRVPYLPKGARERILPRPNVHVEAAF